MTYQMLCTDVDGTLLNNKGEITEGNKKAVAAALAAGKKIVLCSGRTWHSLRIYENTLGLDIPGQYGIGFNGGAVYETVSPGEKRLLYSEQMPRSIAREIFATIEPIVAGYSEMYIVAYNNEGTLIAEASMENMDKFDELRRLGARTVPKYTEVPGDMYKILVHGKHEDLQEIASFTREKFAGKCQTMFSARSLLELLPLGVDKGRGITFLAAHLGIPLEAVIAVGDEANDIAMLQQAGLGIAVANAVPDAKAAADVQLTATHNEDAVGVAIHTYLCKS